MRLRGGRVKALSIQQPWAWLIVNGFKNIENRKWSTKIRGEILIHAGKKIDKDGYLWVSANFPDIPLPSVGDLQVGGIVGKATITDCAPKDTSKWFFGPFGFVLANAETVPFHPCKGMLGFFNVEMP